MLDLLLDAIRSAILVTGLVVIMMMLIESFNVESNGRVFRALKKNNFLQIVVSALLGAVPGCVGGFAAVSLYTHRMLSFGALLAMMIATAGDESFMMLAMFPKEASLLFLGLFVFAVVSGVVADAVYKNGRAIPTRLEDTYDCHEEDTRSHKNEKRHYGWKRLVMTLGIIIFLAALLSGNLEHGHEAETQGLDLLNEEWMFWLFGALSLLVLATLALASDHFVEEHLWEHVVLKHLPSILAWTSGVLLLIGIIFHFVDLDTWVRDNTALMMLLAILVGLIPESGPHLVFVTLFASGVIPFPVLIVNTLVQEGHAGLPLLADSRSAFLKAKAVKVCVALVFILGWCLFFGK